MESRVRNNLSAIPNTPMVGHDQRWVTVKIWIRSCSTVLAAVALCLGIALSLSYSFTGLVVIIPCVFVIAWNAAEFITVCTRRDRARGIKPAVLIGVELVMWLGLLGGTGFEGYLEAYHSSEALYWMNYLAWIKVEAVATVLLSLLTRALHFTLFVRAAVEVDRKKKDLRVQELILAIQKQNTNNGKPPKRPFTGGAESTVPIHVAEDNIKYRMYPGLDSHKFGQPVEELSTGLHTPASGSTRN
ncbi:uncharacterized protein BCR38DRAFT_38335 [Pseudomassariella vexata]|uniref:Uncharacterized protein n=1 Tax=Pseudomassariella vexata TaxID=1141098 RepID=A0A1Y2DQX6_9PEZI|nr:uncharacterized protein BCR38DRAFT_38335 [Pseudomassariella vexata]ORY61688.1 hypothetical protein BCR38DRAFT_38335 [Pseudomassariella vexata]